ncbi:sigma-70 family RNA polymerase sigma factor [Plantactinospora mayteni]|uniref:RNA polymerase sigma factor n=1 Tax=Plantactinospora mayteni TaxID=566021 RepID=A0ABQ4EFQ5_9ACTN|nr:sigma-70 family RNA polymerase sigma factor [Plantactinospora mayteni]GIG93553.1 RNA polymerase sigma factor [Plantactinospora mayteni]
MLGSPDNDNADLLARAAAGDQVAWNTLVDRHNSLLWSIARSFRLDVADAADAVQNTWLRLVENLDRIADPERLASWLGTTARRECLQLIRRAGRRPTGGTPELLAELPDPAPPLDAALLLDERDAALWRALEGLSERCRQLLRILMASPPPRYAEVAAALGMAVGTIGPARQRCLESLRQVVAADNLLGDRASTGRERP